MSDSFIPEADALDQRREVDPQAEVDDSDRAALDYPERIPAEASEADVLEQDQSVESDDDWRQ